MNGLLNEPAMSEWYLMKQERKQANEMEWNEAMAAAILELQSIFIQYFWIQIAQSATNVINLIIAAV